MCAALLVLRCAGRLDGAKGVTAPPVGEEEVLQPRKWRPKDSCRRNHCMPGLGEGQLRSDYLWIVGRAIIQEKGTGKSLEG